MPLTYRRIKMSEKKYVIQMARDEIGIELKRLNEYKTYIIYNEGDRIGCVSFGFRPDLTIYIYVLIFEPDAQRQGFASEVFDSLMQYGEKKHNHRFRGLSATIHKVNDPAINAASKHGFLVTNERDKYFDFIKPIS